MNNKKNVLCCVIEWMDGDTPRLSVAGWSDCPHQKKQIFDEAIKSLDIDMKYVNSIRFENVEFQY